MDQNTLLLIVVDGLSVISGLGGIILVVLAAKHPRQRVIAGALVGGLTGLLIVAAPSELGSAVASVLGLGLGALGGIAVAYLVEAALSVRSGRFAFMGALRDVLERTLLPSRWAIAAGKPPITARDLAKRCFVTIAATTGGVVGSLLEMNRLWEALIHALAPQRLFATLVVTTVSVALVGPLHEYVLDRGMHNRGPDPIPFGHALAAMWDHMSLRAAGRLGLVFLALVQVEAIYGSVHDSMSQGNSSALVQVLLGGMEPGIISFYWSAALQYSAPSVRRAAFLPGMVAEAVMIFGYSAFVAIAGAIAGVALLLTGTPPDTALLWVVGAPIVAAIVLVVFPAVTVAPYAWAGGWVIDRVRGSEPTLYLLAALLAATIPQQLVVVLIYAIYQYTPASATEYFVLFPGTAFWVLGLWASGFPSLVKRGSEAPGERKPAEAPEPYPTEP